MQRKFKILQESRRGALDWNFNHGFCGTSVNFCFIDDGFSVVSSTIDSWKLSCSVSVSQSFLTNLLSKSQSLELMKITHKTHNHHMPKNSILGAKKSNLPHYHPVLQVGSQCEKELPPLLTVSMPYWLASAETTSLLFLHILGIFALNCQLLRFPAVDVATTLTGPLTCHPEFVDILSYCLRVYLMDVWGSRISGCPDGTWCSTGDGDLIHGLELFALYFIVTPSSPVRARECVLRIRSVIVKGD